MELQFRSELATLQANLDSLQSENDTLALRFQPKAEVPQGDFFTQLRAIDANRVRLEGDLAGLRRVRKRMDSEIGLHDTKTRRLQQQADALSEELDRAAAERRARADRAAERREELLALDRELESEVQACTELREIVRGTAAGEKTPAEKAVASLAALKAEYEARLRQKRAEIQRLAKVDRNAHQSHIVHQKQAQRIAEKTISPSNWMGERAVLATKIRRAQEELISVEKREKGASQFANQGANAVDEEEAKIAIVREIRELETPRSRFLSLTLQSELEVQEQLKEKLREFEKVQIDIQEFMKRTSCVANQQKANAMMEPRLNVLRAELSEFRALL
jgi:hypothetical protein